MFGVGDGLGAGGEDLAEVFEDDFADDFDDDFDLAKVPDARPRQRTPATKRKRNRGAFIINSGAGWVP